MAPRRVRVTARIPVLVENLLDYAGATNRRYGWLRKKNTADARRQGYNAKLEVQVIRALTAGSTTLVKISPPANSPFLVGLLGHPDLEPAQIPQLLWQYRYRLSQFERVERSSAHNKSEQAG